MGWVYQKKNNHTCKAPSSESGAAVGDIWQCSCGKMWRVKKVDHGDQRDPGPWLTYEEYNGPVPAQKTGLPRDNNGLYAPGTK